MGKQGWVTLLSSEDYIEGVLVLNESLKRVGSKYPLLVAVTEDIYDKYHNKLCNAGMLPAKVNKLVYSNKTLEDVEKKWPNQKQVLNTASKLNIFDFTDWEKLVYIDADVLVLKNMDDLFSYRDCSMVKYANDQMGFTGLFVIEPSHHYKQFYFTLMENESCFDGDLFGHLWLPFVSYNKEYQIPECYLGYPHEDYDIIKSVHFCNSPKPWNDNYDFSGFDPRLGEKYKAILDYVRKYQ